MPIIETHRFFTGTEATTGSNVADFPGFFIFNGNIYSSVKGFTLTRLHLGSGLELAHQRIRLANLANVPRTQWCNKTHDN
jgi:hypothetical protein